MSTASVSPLADPVAGLLWPPELSDIRRGDPTVFVAGTRTGDLTGYGFEWIDEIPGSGAGLSREEAEWAAIGECVERYALASVVPERVVLGRHSELREAVVPSVGPDTWAFFDPGQDAVTPFSSFTDETTVAWLEGETLLGGRAYLVPACIVWLPYFGIATGESIVAPAVSTGAACATSRAAAVTAGICELVERDAFMIVWRDRLACTRVEIDGGSELAPIFSQRFARPGLDYRLWLTTLDLEIPSIFGVLRDTRDREVRTVVAGAAALDPSWAARKTLLELVQGLVWLDQIAAEPFVYDEDFANVTSFEDRVKLYATNDLEPAFAFLDRDGTPPVALSSLRSRATGSAAEDVEVCASILSAHSLDPIVIDLTPPDVASCGLHTTRVLVPGLETMDGDHRFPFLGGRRWRNLPVELGLRPQPLGIEDVNPYPHPYP